MKEVTKVEGRQFKQFRIYITEPTVE